jgi:hypothetical protein
VEKSETVSEKRFEGVLYHKRRRGGVVVSILKLWWRIGAMQRVGQGSAWQAGEVSSRFKFERGDLEETVTCKWWVLKGKGGGYRVVLVIDVVD